MSRGAHCHLFHYRMSGGPLLSISLPYEWGAHCRLFHYRMSEGPIAVYFTTVWVRGPLPSISLPYEWGVQYCRSHYCMSEGPIAIYFTTIWVGSPLPSISLPYEWGVPAVYFTTISLVTRTSLTFTGLLPYLWVGGPTAVNLTTIYDDVLFIKWLVATYGHIHKITYSTSWSILLNSLSVTLPICLVPRLSNFSSVWERGYLATCP